MCNRLFNKIVQHRPIMSMLRQLQRRRQNKKLPVPQLLNVTTARERTAAMTSLNDMTKRSVPRIFKVNALKDELLVDARPHVIIQRIMSSLNRWAIAFFTNFKREEQNRAEKLGTYLAEITRAVVVTRSHFTASWTFWNCSLWRLWPKWNPDSEKDVKRKGHETPEVFDFYTNSILTLEGLCELKNFRLGFRAEMP